jgi:hypothetical protein
MASEGTDTVLSAITYTLGANVENLTLTGSADIDGTGNELDNVLTGNSGVNVLTGGTGNDIYVVGPGDAVVEHVDEGTDTVESALTYTLGSDVESLTLMGNADIDGTGNTLDNVLTGNSGSNVLDGGAGDDVLSGGGGHDTYQFNWGYGVDTIVDTAGPGAGNVLRFGSGITLDSVILGYSGSTLQIQIGYAGDMVQLGGFDPADAYEGTPAIATFQFDDGSALSYAQLIDWAFDFIGTTGDDILTGTSATDLFNGQTGNDVQNGGRGTDQYVYGWGDGQDTIIDTDSTPGNTDRLIFYDVIDPMHLVLSREANDLRLAVYESTGSVTIQDWYLGTDQQVEDIQAASGQYHLANTQVEQLIQAMASFSQQTGLTWEQGLAQQPQQVQSILAANWQGM